MKNCCGQSGPCVKVVRRIMTGPLEACLWTVECYMLGKTLERGPCAATSGRPFLPWTRALERPDQPPAPWNADLSPCDARPPGGSALLCHASPAAIETAAGPRGKKRG